MTFDELRRNLSSHFGQAIPPEGLESVAKVADSQGRFDQKRMQLMLIEIYNYLESNANQTV